MAGMYLRHCTAYMCALRNSVLHYAGSLSAYQTFEQLPERTQGTTRVVQRTAMAAHKHIPAGKRGSPEESPISEGIAAGGAHAAMPLASPCLTTWRRSCRALKLPTKAFAAQRGEARKRQHCTRLQAIASIRKWPREALNASRTVRKFFASAFGGFILMSASSSSTSG